MKKLMIFVILVLLGLALSFPQRASAAPAMSTPAPGLPGVPTPMLGNPLPTPAPDSASSGNAASGPADPAAMWNGDGSQPASGSASTSTQSTGSNDSDAPWWNPGEALAELVREMIKSLLGDLDEKLEGWLVDIANFSWDVMFTSHGEGMFTTAAKVFTGVGVILFIPAALLRVVWYHKQQLVDGSDSLISVALDIVFSAVVVLGIGPFMDWVFRSENALVSMVLKKALDGGLPQHLGIEEMYALMSNSIASLFFLGPLLFGGILALLGLIAAFFAVQGVYYVLMALAPVVFPLGMFPPLGWTKRLWWMGFGAVLLAPFVGAAALAALVFLGSVNFGIDILFVKYVIRMVWLWSAAGLMWTLIFMLTKATIATSMELAGRVAKGVADIAGGLLGAAAIAGTAGVGGAGLLGGALGGGAGAGGAAVAGGAVGSGATTDAGATAAVGGDAVAGGHENFASLMDDAASHAAQAGVAEALSRVPGLGAAMRPVATYHRTLSNVARLNAMGQSRPRRSGGAEEADKYSTGVVPYASAEDAFRQAGGDGDFHAHLNAVQERFGSAVDEDGAPVAPKMWAQYTDDPKASLAGALAALHAQGEITPETDWATAKMKAQSLLDVERKS